MVTGIFSRLKANSGKDLFRAMAVVLACAWREA